MNKITNIMRTTIMIIKIITILKMVENFLYTLNKEKKLNKMITKILLNNNNLIMEITVIKTKINIVIIITVTKVIKIVNNNNINIIKIIIITNSNKTVLV